MTASAQGIDVSSYQAVVTAGELSGYAFAFCKVSEGVSIVDPHFAANWATMREVGIHRGGYHEFYPGDGPVAQAQLIVTAVKTQGLEPGDMLAIVASDYPGVTSGMIRACCDEVSALAGPSCPVLIYSDLSVAAQLTTCTGYPLWVSYPAQSAPASVQPWPSWTFWQWSWAPEDQDAFNGTVAELDAWIGSYQPAPVPTVAQWTCEGLLSLADLAGLQLHTSVAEILWVTAQQSPWSLYTAAMTSYLDAVFAKDRAEVPVGVTVWHPDGSIIVPFHSHGDQTLQGLANAWNCEPSTVVRCTAECSPGAVFSPGMSSYLAGVFQRSALKVPAGTVLYYLKS